MIIDAKLIWKKFAWQLSVFLSATLIAGRNIFNLSISVWAFKWAYVQNYPAKFQLTQANFFLEAYNIV